MTRDALEKLWADHLAGEFRSKDVEATLETNVARTDGQPGRSWTNPGGHRHFHGLDRPSQ
jgi:hypothetical protein